MYVDKVIPSLSMSTLHLHPGTDLFVCIQDFFSSCICFQHVGGSRSLVGKARDSYSVGCGFESRFSTYENTGIVFGRRIISNPSKIKVYPNC